MQSLRGLVFSSLVKEQSTELTEVFNGERIPVKGSSPPFVLLRLRILAYMARLQDQGAEEAVPLKRVAKAFESAFGVSHEHIQKAVRGLCRRGVPRLMRDESDGLRAGAQGLVLLPAGHTFVGSIVYSCEFLAWYYDKTYQERVLQGRPHDVKLDKAVAVVQEKILPVFFDEHPYLRPGHEICEADYDRLVSYTEMFGYGPDQWFVSRLARSLSSYAQDRRSRRLKKVLGKIDFIEKRLNSILVNGPEAV